MNNSMQSKKVIIKNASTCSSNTFPGPTITLRNLWSPVTSTLSLLATHCVSRVCHKLNWISTDQSHYGQVELGVVV